MNPEHDLSAAFDDIASGAARTTRGSAALDPQALVNAARRRRRRLTAVTAAASAAAIVAIGGVGVAMTLGDAPPSPPAGTPTPPSPSPTESARIAPDPVTGSVGPDACGRPLAELPWQADDRIQLVSDAGPQLDGSALEIDISLLSREGHWKHAADLDAVVLDSSGLVVAYLTGATPSDSVSGLTYGPLLPCESGTDTLLPDTYELVAALAFVETTPMGQLVGATPAHAVRSWDLEVPAEPANSP